MYNVRFVPRTLGFSVSIVILQMQPGLPAYPHFAMKRFLLCASVALAPAVAVAPAIAQTSSAAAIRIPFEKYSLPNGLTVVLAPDHSTPTVAVNVQYHVGSKNEVPGHTGFAHMFEHVMFTGSGHVPYGMHDRFTEGVGGQNNGETYFDWTRYYETDPSNYLEHALWLESDRMGFLLDSLDEKKFKAQRDIVQNERRQNYDNRPNGRDNEVIGLTMYPNGHPYSWPTIGSMSDLKGATVEDVKNFFREYYAPNNATLVIVGDFDPAVAKAMVAKYFADIPRGRTVSRPNVAPAHLADERRITLEDRIQVPQLTIAWPSAGVRSADQPALDVLSDILGNSRTARITKALVYDKQAAARANVFQNPTEDVGQFQVILTPRPGHTLTELETVADSIIDAIKRDGPTADELARVKAGQQAQLISGLQSNLGKAWQLAMDQTLFSDPSYTFRVEYPRTQAVTAADVKRVANKYLGKGRVILSDVPIGKPELASHSDKSKIITDPFTEMREGARP
jgi:zinc protease